MIFFFLSNQEIYSSSLISWDGFKSLAHILYWDILLKRFHSHFFFFKGLYSQKIWWFFQFNQVDLLIIPISWSSVKPLAQILWDIFMAGFHSDFCRKGSNLDKKTRWSPQGMNAPATTSLGFFLAKFLNKSRVCNSSNKNLIRVLWLYAHALSISWLSCKFRTITLTLP